MQTDLLVIGLGPGGTAAAFRAADLGLNVTCVNSGPIGGTCLNVGCIPSKAYLHAAEMRYAIDEIGHCGLTAENPQFDFEKLRSWNKSVVNKLNTGLNGLAKMRKVQVIEGSAKFLSKNEVEVTSDDGSVDSITFKNVIIAAGSRPVKLPFVPEDERIFDSTGALELKNPTGKLLVLGGGIIGCEMATFYRAMGAEVTVVEMMPQIMPGADLDLVAPCQKMLEKRGVKFLLAHKVTQVEALSKSLAITIEDSNGNETVENFAQMLVSVGRVPNSDLLDLDKASIEINARNFIVTDKQKRTNLSNIYAIGDITTGPMLAHKAAAEGHLVAEVIAGKRVEFDHHVIPSVAYTDPEVAWVGMTEQEAKDAGYEVGKGVFPWMANGRSLCLGRTEGLSKVLVDKKTGRLLGVGAVGRHAGDIISIGGVVIEMEGDVEDLAATIHPHPTLAETIMMAAENYLGKATDLPPSK